MSSFYDEMEYELGQYYDIGEDCEDYRPEFKGKTWKEVFKILESEARLDHYEMNN